MANRDKKSMLRSTACLIAGMAFFAGVLFGSLLTAPPGGGDGQPSQPASEAPPGDTRQHAPEMDARVAQLRMEIARNPNEALNWIHLGNEYFDSDHYSEAIEAYGKALELSPNNADVLTDLGTMYRYSGDGVRAVEAYDRAIGINPRHQNAHYNKGLTTLIELADPQGALEAWQELLRVVPDAKVGDGVPLAGVLDAVLTNGGAHLESSGRHEAALKTYDLALRQNPSFAPALAHKGALLEQLARGGEAQVVWRTLLAIDPQAVTPDGRKVADLLGGSVD